MQRGGASRCGPGGKPGAFDATAGLREEAGRASMHIDCRNYFDDVGILNVTRPWMPNQFVELGSVDT